MSNLLYDTLFGKHADGVRIFLHLPDETEITHQAFLEHAAQFAQALTSLGLTAGDRVAVQVEKSRHPIAHAQAECRHDFEP